LSVALVVGLGNPGENYRGTRHNLGFEVAVALAARLGAGREQEVCGALLTGDPAGEWWIARPQTYMNRSGFAVRCLAERLTIAPERILVVYDDVSLPLGRVRLRADGGPGGHRGMESVIENLQTPRIARLRLGILPLAPESSNEPDAPTIAPSIAPDKPAGDLADFVLGAFTADEAPHVSRLLELAVDACLAWGREGLAPAMNRFNR
jgi:PTH1 family peptidyl-tRNA hydrolase